MSERGDINERIRSQIEQDGKYPMDADYYMRLGFLGSARDFINSDDVAALAFNGDIDFSGELGLMANPEEGVRDAMNGMFEKVRKEFDAINTKLRKRFEEAGVEVTDEIAAKFFLNPDKASITVDNRGAVKVEGWLAGDDATNRQGLAIIERLARQMLLETGNNSYQVNLFTAASQSMIDRQARENGGGTDARVVARMENGTVRDVYLARNHTESKLERQLQTALNNASTHVRK